MSRKKSRNNFRNKSRTDRKSPLADLRTGLLAAGLSIPVLAGAQSKPYPTYVTGPQPDGSWVVSSGQVITPTGTQVNLGIRVRAKAIALNPNVGTHTAAVLTMGTSSSDGNGAVEVFDTRTGVVLQNYIPFKGTDPSGSYKGIAYSADGTHLVFGQDSSHVTIADVSAEGLLSDDAQNGVDHVDGHRSPGYIVSPYAVQNGPTDHTYYTQVNMTRTMEQILGLPPMNQFDLVASPMRTAFVKGTPPADNFLPWTHVPNIVSFYQGTVASNTMGSPAVKALRAAWLQKKAQIFAGKLTKPDSEDPDTVNHLNWYMATGFVRPYPGEKTVRPPSEFNNPAPTKADQDD